MPRAITSHPQEPAEVLSSFLPDLLALPNDKALSVVLEYLYHPSPRVRAYASDALYYWPNSVVEPRLMQTLRTNGPAPSVLPLGRAARYGTPEAALPYFFSDDPVLFQERSRQPVMRLRQPPPLVRNFGRAWNKV